MSKCRLPGVPASVSRQDIPGVPRRRSRRRKRSVATPSRYRARQWGRIFAVNSCPVWPRLCGSAAPVGRSSVCTVASGSVDAFEGSRAGGAVAERRPLGKVLEVEPGGPMTWNPARSRAGAASLIPESSPIKEEESHDNLPATIPQPRCSQ